MQSSLARSAYLGKLLLQCCDLGLFGADPAATHNLRWLHVGRDLPAAAHAQPLESVLWIRSAPSDAETVTLAVS